MNKETRIQKIQEIIDINEDDPFGILEIPWEDDLISMNVYKIPLENLVYNKYNGRILSRTKSLERQNIEIDSATDKGKKLIAKLLWDSRPERNQKTLNSIDRGGQQKPGIVTRDGIIIDGNRRVMLLNRILKYDYFKAVVLPVTLDENPLEIEKLETTYQMGEDEKLGYNPTEKYLKAKVLYKKLTGKTFSAWNHEPDKTGIKKISDWMGETEPTIRDYLRVMETMDDYLKYWEYDGIYTQLDNREEQSIGLTNWLINFYGENSVKAFEGYRDSDVDHLRAIAYDYIRIKYKNERFRFLARGRRENHVFGSKKVWKSFRDRHFNFSSTIEEAPIDLNSPNLKTHLDDRDNKFKDNVEEDFNKNIDAHYQELQYRKDQDEPSKLIKNAKRALKNINRKHKAFKAPDVAEELESVNEVISEMLCQSSAGAVFSQVLHLLNSIDLDQEVEAKDELAEKAKEIQRLTYQISKDIKKL